jgi:hypothetical protein
VSWLISKTKARTWRTNSKVFAQVSKPKNSAVWKRSKWHTKRCRDVSLQWSKTESGRRRVAAAVVAVAVVVLLELLMRTHKTAREIRVGVLVVVVVTIVPAAAAAAAAVVAAAVDLLVWRRELV